MFVSSSFWFLLAFSSFQLACSRTPPEMSDLAEDSAAEGESGRLGFGFGFFGGAKASDC